LPGSRRSSGRSKLDRARIDKWLFHARFYRTRALAQAAARSGRLRLNGARVEKPGHNVAPGDVLTLGRGSEILAVRVLELGVRRGSAGDASLLYEILGAPALDMQPPPP
jgi:ribosome-associated heat shock protein Hsp15